MYCMEMQELRFAISVKKSLEEPWHANTIQTFIQKLLFLKFMPLSCCILPALEAVCMYQSTRCYGRRKADIQLETAG